MDELQILVKAIISENSEQSMDSQLASLTKKLANAHEISLKVNLDDKSVQAVQSQLQAIAKQVSATSSAAKSGGNSIKVFDSTQLKADGQRYFNGVRDIISRVQKEFGKMGQVDVTNVFKDAKGNIQSFTASVTKADGVVEKFNFELAKIKNGTRNLTGFVQSNSILSDKSAGSELEKTLNFLNRIDTKIEDITSKTLKNTSKPLLGNMEQFNQYQTRLTEVKNRIEEIKKSNSTLSGEHKREIASMVADLQRYAKELQNSAYAATDLNAATFANKKAELQAALQTDIKKWQSSGIFGGEFETAVNQAKTALDNALDPSDLEAYKHQLSLLQQQFKQFKLDSTASGKLIDADILNTNIQTAQQRILNLRNTYSAFVSDPDLLAKWEALFDSSTMVSSKKELQKLNADIRKFEQELINAGKHSRSLFDELKANAVKMGTWMILGGVIAGIMRGVTGLYDAVVDLDTAMTELKKVTNETDEAYDNFLSSAAEKAVQIGTSYSDFVTSTADFARLGYTMDESAKLAEVANIYAVVGDEISGVDDATTSIISTMKAFGIEVDDAMSIVDKFNEVGNNFAISSGGIGEAMQRSASALSAANNTIDESIALVVAANNVVQDPAMVGTMWKTVSMRIRGATTELEEAGLETEYMAESTASLQKKIKALTNVDGLGGFDIMADADNFKSTYEIILGISEVWEDMSDIDQAALLELLAGKRQGNALSAAITNMDDAVRAMKTSVDSEDSALKEHEKWMDSIAAKQQQFQAQYEAFANAVLDSELIKGVYDAGTGLLGWLTQLVDTLGALPTLLATITPFFDKMQLFKSDSSKNWFGSGTGIQFAWNSGKTELENDIRLLEEYNAKISGLGKTQSDLTQRQIVWNDTIGKGSSKLKDSIRVTDDATVSTDAYKTSMNGASGSTVAMGVASKAAAVGVQVLKTALNMLIGLGVGLAINAIVSGITKLINKQKEAKEEALESGRAAAENGEELLELATSYLTLSRAVEAGTGSQEELASIQDELIAYLKTQGVVVNDLAGDYDDLRASIIAASREALQTDISLALRAADVSKEEAIKDSESWLGTGSFSTNKDSEKEALQWLYDNGYSSSSSLFYLPNSDAWDVFSNPTFEELVENRTYLEEAMNALSADFGVDTDNSALFAWIVDAYNKYDALLEDAIEDIDNANSLIAKDLLLAAEATKSPESLEEFDVFRKNLIQSLSGNINFDENGSYTAEELVDSTLRSNTVYADYLNQLEEQEITAKAIQEKRRAIAEALVPKDYEYLEPGTAAYFHAIGEWGTKVAEFQNKLKELSDEDFEVAYNAVINEGATTWDEIVAAIEKYHSAEQVALRSTEELKTSLKTLWNSEDFSDAKEELVAMAKTLDGITPQKVEELAEESDALAAILEEDGMNAAFLANILQSMAEGGDGLSLITTDALKLNDALDGMTGKFDQVTEAKARYDAAMSVEEKDTDFKSYAEAFEELNAQFEAGTTNSNAFWAAAEFLFGSEQLATWGWSDGLDEIYTAMQNNKAVFSDADSAGAGFIERLYQMAQAGELVNEEGEKLLEIGKDSSGAYFFDIDPDNIEEIAKKMGITEEAALACLKALSMWGDIDFYDLTEVAEVIEEIGLSCEAASGKAITVDRLTEQLLTLGKTQKEINDVIQALGEMDGVQLFTISEEVDGLTESLQELGLATEDGVTIQVDYEGLADLLSNLGYTKEEAEKLITKLGEADNISLANADGEVKDVSDALEYIDTLTFTEVTTELSDITGAVGELDESSTDNVVSEIDEIGEAADVTVTKIYGIKDALEKVDGQTATVYYKVEKKGSILGSIFGFAKGTKSAPAGDALVGEEGTELVQSGNHAYLVGQNGAEIVHLNEGDQVYTAEQTRRMFSSSGRTIRGVIPAYATGRVNTSGLRVETNKTGSTGTPYKVSVDVTADPTDLEDALKETLEAMEEELDEILGNFEHNIFLLEKNDGTPEEIIAIYKAMQKKVHEQAEAYRALGLDDTSDYIQELQKKWWDYQDTIDDMLHEIYKTAVEEHENAISLLEHQYDVLDGLRNSDGMSENLEKQIEEQRKIQQLAHDEAQRLRELGVDENDDAIQECIDAWWDAEESIRDINSKIADNILDTFDDFIEYADDFELWADLDFTKVDYLKQKITAINKLFKDGVLTLKEYNELLRETQLDIYNEQKDALTEIIEKTMELVRQEAEDQIDALEDQIDKYQKIIELKKEALATSKDEESYEKEVAKRVAEIAKIQAKIAQLDRDDSREANAEKQQLAQELAELQEELADYQANYSYNAQVDALDKEADTFEDTKNKEIEKVEASVDTEEAVYKAAIARIDSDWNALYDDLIEWNKKYGDMIDGEDSITTAWQTAKAAAQEYGSVVAALDGINSSISYEEQVIASQKANEEAIHSIIKEMYANSQAHHSADTEGKARLNKRNLELGAQLAQYGITAIRGEDGVWYVDRIGGTKLYDKYKEYTYHTGGIVGEDALKSNEVLAKLEKGEVVMTENQFSGLFGRIKECVSGIVDGIVQGLTSSEPAVSEVVRSITNNDMDTDNSVTENGIVIQNEFNVQGMDEENMKQFAEYYSDYTIDKLISAKKRKGLKNSVGSHMLR